MAIADATSDQDLHVLGKLVMEQSLVVAGSGIAIGFEAPGAMGQNLVGQSHHESVASLPGKPGQG
jgi:uncharacterized protein YgbK (DUF1537 family)